MFRSQQVTAYGLHQGRPFCMLAVLNRSGRWLSQQPELTNQWLRPENLGLVRGLCRGRHNDFGNTQD